MKPRRKSSSSTTSGGGDQQQQLPPQEEPPPSPVANPPPPLEWEDHSQHLGPILRHYSLPLVVTCDRRGLAAVETVNFDFTQPLLLHTRRSVRKVSASSVAPVKGGDGVCRLEEVGDHVLIPQDYKGWFAVLGPRDKVKPDRVVVPHFRQVAQLAMSKCESFLIGGSEPVRAFQLPTSGRAGGDGDLQAGTQTKLVYPGDVLRMGKLYVGESTVKIKKLWGGKKMVKKEEKFLSCTDEKDLEVYLPVESRGTFYIVTNTEGQGQPKIPILRMPDICTQFRFPCVVKLLFGRVPSTPCSFTGTLVLRDAQTESSVIGCTMLNLRNILLDIPIDSDLKFFLAKGTLELLSSKCYKSAKSLCRDKAPTYMRNMKVACYIKGDKIGGDEGDSLSNGAGGGGDDTGGEEEGEPPGGVPGEMSRSGSVHSLGRVSRRTASFSQPSIVEDQELFCPPETSAPLSPALTNARFSSTASSSLKGGGRRYVPNAESGVVASLMDGATTLGSPTVLRKDKTYISPEQELHDLRLTHAHSSPAFSGGSPAAEHRPLPPVLPAPPPSDTPAGHYITMEESAGHGRTQAPGPTAASGQYITMVDSDGHGRLAPAKEASPGQYITMADSAGHGRLAPGKEESPWHYIPMVDSAGHGRLAPGKEASPGHYITMMDSNIGSSSSDPPPPGQYMTMVDSAGHGRHQTQGTPASPGHYNNSSSSPGHYQTMDNNNNNISSRGPPLAARTRGPSLTLPPEHYMTMYDSSDYNGSSQEAARFVVGKPRASSPPHSHYETMENNNAVAADSNCRRSSQEAAVVIVNSRASPSSHSHYETMENNSVAATDSLGAARAVVGSSSSSSSSSSPREGGGRRGKPPPPVSPRPPCNEPRSSLDNDVYGQVWEAQGTCIKTSSGRESRQASEAETAADRTSSSSSSSSSRAERPDKRPNQLTPLSRGRRSLALAGTYLTVPMMKVEPRDTLPSTASSAATSSGPSPYTNVPDTRELWNLTSSLPHDEEESPCHYQTPLSLPRPISDVSQTPPSKSSSLTKVPSPPPAPAKGSPSLTRVGRHDQYETMSSVSVSPDPRTCVNVCEEEEEEGGMTPPSLPLKRGSSSRNDYYNVADVRSSPTNFKAKSKPLPPLPGAEPPASESRPSPPRIVFVNPSPASSFRFSETGSSFRSHRLGEPELPAEPEEDDESDGADASCGGGDYELMLSNGDSRRMTAAPQGEAKREGTDPALQRATSFTYYEGCDPEKQRPAAEAVNNIPHGCFDTLDRQDSQASYHNHMMAEHKNPFGSGMAKQESLSVSESDEFLYENVENLRLCKDGASVSHTSSSEVSDHNSKCSSPQSHRSVPKTRTTTHCTNGGCAPSPPARPKRGPKPPLAKKPAVDLGLVSNPKSSFESDSSGGAAVFAPLHSALPPPPPPCRSSASTSLGYLEPRTDTNSWNIPPHNVLGYVEPRANCTPPQNALGYLDQCNDTATGPQKDSSTSGAEDTSPHHQKDPSYLSPCTVEQLRNLRSKAFWKVDTGEGHQPPHDHQPPHLARLRDSDALSHASSEDDLPLGATFANFTTTSPTSDSGCALSSVVADEGSSGKSEGGGASFGDSARTTGSTEVSCLSVDGLGSALRTAGLTRQTAECLREQRVDGALLVSLDEEELKEALPNVRKLEIKKIRMFVNGWRPS